MTMSNRKYALFWLSILICSGTAFLHIVVSDAHAASFKNLGFEDAVIGSPPVASQALPFWTLSTGNYVVFNNIALDSAWVSIHDTDSVFVKPLQGNYSIVLQDGLIAAQTLGSASIWQAGDIPNDAKSLMFKSNTPNYIDELRVSLNGVSLPFVVYSTDGFINPGWLATGPVKTYACDISAFTGTMNATLKFEKLVHDPNDIVWHGLVDLDAITFSTVVVPEPSSLVILAFGLFALATYTRRRRNWA
jgi:hypothetical protein